MIIPYVSRLLRGLARRMGAAWLGAISFLGLLAFHSISQAQILNAPLEATFQNPIDGGAIIGLGTNSIRFSGDTEGGLKIDLAPKSSYSLGQPFLLGLVSFTAGGEMPSRISLAPLVEMVDANDYTCKVEFSVPMTLREFREPGLRVGELILNDDSIATGTFQDALYTVKLFGFTDVNDFNEPSTNLLQSVFGEERQAYLWAVAYADPSGSPTEGTTTTDCDCHCQPPPPPPAVPEPSSLILAGGGILLALVLGVYHRRKHFRLATSTPA